MGSIAFALRREYQGTTTQVEEDGADPVEVPVFTGGLIAVADDRDLNVGEELEAGDGLVVVDEHDTAALIALDAYPALKRVDAPDDAAITGGYDERKATELRAELERRGITGAGQASKADAVTALEALDAIAADGRNVADDSALAAVLDGTVTTTDPDAQA